MKAAIYARYSSDNQREESITAQIRAAHEYCQKNGHEIIKEYTDEALSARTDDRPAFQQMITDAQEGLFEILIIHKVDRFSRNRYDAAFYKRILKKSGVKISYVDQHLDDSPESVILESVLEGMAEYYSKNLAREVKKGQKENALQAKHNGGIPPLGYDVSPDKTYIINPDEAIIVKRIFSQYAKGIGLGTICTELNGAGFKTKRGSAFSKNGLYEILRNDKYIGNYTYGKSSLSAEGKRNGRKPAPDMILIENALPAIIDKTTWEIIKAKSKKRQTGNRAKEVYLLSGIIKCPCGATLVGNRYKNRETKSYSYYRCNRSMRTGQCNHPKYPKEKLEELIMEKILPSIFSQKAAKGFITTINKKMAQFAEEKLAHINTLEKQKKSAKSKIESLLCMIENGNTSPIFAQRIQDNENTIQLIDLQLRKIQTTMKKITLTENQLLQIFNNLQKEKEPAALKLLAQTIIKTATIDGDTINIVLNINGSRFGLKMATLQGLEPRTF